MTWCKVRIRSELQAKNMAKEELKHSFNSTSKSTPFQLSVSKKRGISKRELPKKLKLWPAKLSTLLSLITRSLNCSTFTTVELYGEGTVHIENLYMRMKGKKKKEVEERNEYFLATNQ